MSIEESKTAMESYLKRHAEKAGTGGKCEVLFQGSVPRGIRALLRHAGAAS